MRGDGIDRRSGPDALLPPGNDLPTMIDEKLLASLKCPDTGQPLEILDAASIDRLNEEVAAGRLKNLGGSVIGQPLDGGLLARAAGKMFPVFDGIPVLILDEAIHLGEDILGVEPADESHPAEAP